MMLSGLDIARNVEKRVELRFGYLEGKDSGRYSLRILSVSQVVGIVANASRHCRYRLDERKITGTIARC
jgi:hypothetical protein